MKRFVGTKAPDFHIHGVSGDGEMFQDLCLEAYKGHWLVLFFYPMDFTFVCPTELLPKPSFLMWSSTQLT